MKEKLNKEALEMVAGGAGEDWEEIVRRMINNSEQADVSTENQSDPEPLLPHSKKIKGKLYK